jgi:hypothetical protein
VSLCPKLSHGYRVTVMSHPHGTMVQKQTLVLISLVLHNVRPNPVSLLTVDSTVSRNMSLTRAARLCLVYVAILKLAFAIPEGDEVFDTQVGGRFFVFADKVIGGTPCRRMLLACSS